MIDTDSLSAKHAVVCNDRNIFKEKRGPVKCVYIINGVYIGSTNDLKRRVREYIGRAKRNEPVRSETPIMRHIKEQLSTGRIIKFCILDNDPDKEFLFIQRIEKRGVSLLNVKMVDKYHDAVLKGKSGRYRRMRDTNLYQKLKDFDIA